MSSYERNKGRLIPTGIDTEHFTDDEYEMLYENGQMVIDGEVYDIEYVIKGETDCFDFAEVSVDDDGVISFHTVHYNGGAYITEVIEGALNKQEVV